jgi:hypothetical protein
MTTPTAAPTGRAAIIYKIHWHVVFTHFPVSAYLGSAGFMLLHLFSHRTCFELAAYVTLIAGAIVMVPTTLTGWFTWKGRYKGALTRIFLYKIRISFAMIALSLVLIIWRTVFARPPYDIWLALYAIGIFLLFIGTIVEGYYGGRLNHR